MTLRKVRSCKDPLVEMGCPACDLQRDQATHGDSMQQQFNDLQFQLQSYKDLQRLSPLTVHRSKGKRCTSTGITRVFHAFQHGSDTAQHHRCLNDLNDLANDQESLLVLSVSMTLQVESQSHGKKIAGRMVPTQTAQLIWRYLQHGFE